MKQEEKELLKDLCARLPYRTKCYCEWSKDAPNGTSGCVQELSTFLIDELEMMGEPGYDCQISSIKPYLRSLSSMTEKEKTIYQSKQTIIFDFKNNKLYVDNYYSLDYLNSIHADYRGLIEKGLALEALKDMYND